MKKHFILLLSILILITLVGCSTISNNEETTELDNLKAQLLSAKEENENLKAQLLSAKQEKENLIAEMATLKESNEEFAALATKSNEIINDLEAKLTELKEGYTENN